MILNVLEASGKHFGLNFRAAAQKKILKWCEALSSFSLGLVALRVQIPIFTLTWDHGRQFRLKIEFLEVQMYMRLYARSLHTMNHISIGAWVQTISCSKERRVLRTPPHFIFVESECPKFVDVKFYIFCR